jgi:hypothetical protein
MTKYALIGASALIIAALATPALAQAVVEDPGYCAQFYPDANCQNYGSGNPVTRDSYRHLPGRPNGQALMHDRHLMHNGHHRRHRTHTEHTE